MDGRRNPHPHHHCIADRGQIINRATAYAIEMLYKELKNNTNK